MKKIIKVFIFCAILVGMTFFFWNNPQITKNVAENILSLTDIFKTDAPKYTSDFEINRLHITKSDHYYKKLDENQQNIYDQLALSVSKLESVASLTKYEYIDNELMVSDVSTVIDAFFNDHPEVFYLSPKYKIFTAEKLGKTKVELELEYFVSNKEDLEIKIQEVEVGINEITEIASKENDVFLKELKIHDLLGTNVSYYNYENIDDIPFECHTIYGIFTSKIGVCDGFTKAMQILLDKVKIESILVTGILQNESHAWNMVKLDNEWYHLDLTSNKSLSNNSDDNSLIIHTYFNLTTNEIKNSHSNIDDSLINIANGTKYNYYNYMNKNISSSDDFQKSLTKILDDSVNSKIVEFSTKNITGVSDKIVNVVRNSKYKNSLITNGNSLKYYNILNTFILVKN